MGLKVLIACEYSGIVRDAFLARGHDAVSSDLLPTESPGPHYQGDVRNILGENWDLIIAHPPCQFLSNSGVRWLKTDPDRWPKMQEGARFFRMFLDHPCERIAVENPIMHKYALAVVGRKHDQTVQPWQFGHIQTKRTCFWLKGLPPLVETKNVKAEFDATPINKRSGVHYASPGPDRWKDRSRTFKGIAEAMAEQWG